ncbi:hypothetical protein [Streptomyces sp. NPDC006193]|uniref:hypothetical protein n=1 Tax=Streptomyces sp. NPDC006193 TaxID=3155717 RepID=UPI0033A2C67C
MRLSTPSSLRLAAATAAAAAAAVVVPVAPDTALADATRSCTGADARAFPLAARIRGGPASYRAGGGYGTWYIDLTNTTRRTCAGIHPVVVLVDDRRALRPEQPLLEFHDGSLARPVSFQRTDEEELVGVLDGAGFGGFTVPPGGTVSVRLRLALRSDAVAGQVTATAAVVQRRGEDGDWVGESDAYRFTIRGADGEDAPDAGDATAAPTGSAPATAPGTATPDSPLPSAEGTGGTGAPEDEETPEAEAQQAAGAEEADGAGAGGGGADGAAATGGTAREGAAEADGAEGGAGAGEQGRELARTGPGPTRGPLVAAAAALLTVTGAFLLARRLRR